MQLLQKVTLGLIGALGAGAALAGPPPMSVPVSSEQGAQASDPFAFLGNLNRSNYFLGDLFGLRPWLSRYGMSLAIQETSELLGNASGGTRTGAAYDGLTQAVLQLDTQRGFGHYGGLFNASVLHIHGSNLSAAQLDTLQTSSGIEADRGLRLWELWYDQRLLEEDRLDLRVGQMSVDQEFIVSSNALYFVNTMFGWPALPSYDLPGGGPAYPLSAPGVRVRYRPVNALNVLFGVYNGSPASSNLGDPQRVDAHGTSFPVHGGALAFLEFQYTDPSVGGLVFPGEGAPMARTYKLGAWYDSQRFADLRRDGNGLSLADPASSGSPASHSGNLSLYAVADQMVWRDERDPNHNLNLFVRAMGTPYQDRNLISFSLNAGVVCHEPFRGRPDDTFGLGIGAVHVSRAAAGLDQDTASVAQTAGSAGYYPIRSSETYLEATYQWQVHPWWQIQPDLQYVWNPGGGIQDPFDPARRIRNEVVLGIRTNILF
jgi:porin